MNYRNPFDSTTIDLAAMTREYRRANHQLARQAMQRRAEQGIMPGCPPVGYRNVRRGGESVIEVDEQLAPLVQETFRLAAEGKLSLRQILKIMTEKGLRSRTGRLVGVSGLWNILRNPFYVGLLTHRGKLYPGQHTPLVSEALFTKVQETRFGRPREMLRPTTGKPA